MFWHCQAVSSQNWCFFSTFSRWQRKAIFLTTLLPFVACSRLEHFISFWKQDSNQCPLPAPLRGSGSCSLNVWCCDAAYASSQLISTLPIHSLKKSFEYRLLLYHHEVALFRSIHSHYLQLTFPHTSYQPLWMDFFSFVCRFTKQLCMDHARGMQTGFSDLNAFYLWCVFCRMRMKLIYNPICWGKACRLSSTQLLVNFWLELEVVSANTNLLKFSEILDS